MSGFSKRQPVSTPLNAPAAPQITARTGSASDGLPFSIFGVLGAMAVSVAIAIIAINWLMSQIMALLFSRPAMMQSLGPSDLNTLWKFLWRAGTIAFCAVGALYCVVAHFAARHWGKRDLWPFALTGFLLPIAPSFFVDYLPLDGRAQVILVFIALIHGAVSPSVYWLIATRRDA